MSLSARSIALEGIGYGARAVALQGLVAVDVIAEASVRDSWGGGGHRVRRGPARRWDWQRDDEILPPPIPLPDDPLELPPGLRVRRSRRARAAEELLVLLP